VASLSDPEVRDFLAHGTRTGKLAFLAASGRPLVAPVWFVVEGDSLVFNTGRETAKGRALARDPRASGMRVGLARTLVDKGRPNDARAELLRVLDEKAPSNLADWTLRDAPDARKLLESLPARR